MNTISKIQVKPSILLALVVALFATVASVGCGSESASSQQSENVTSLENELRKLPYSVDVAARSRSPITGQEGEGILSGTISSNDGGSIEFTYSMGPDPQKPSGNGGSWISGGDQFYLRTREPKAMPSKAQLAKQDEMYLDLEDAGCQVVLGEPCPV